MCHPTSLEAQPVARRGSGAGQQVGRKASVSRRGRASERRKWRWASVAPRLSVATARRLERQFDQVQSGCCPKSITQRAVRTCECGTAHGFAERVETPGRHSSTSRLGSPRPAVNRMAFARTVADRGKPGAKAVPEDLRSEQVGRQAQVSGRGRASQRRKWRWTSSPDRAAAMAGPA